MHEQDHPEIFEVQGKIWTWDPRVFILFGMVHLKGPGEFSPGKILIHAGTAKSCILGEFLIIIRIANCIIIYYTGSVARFLLNPLTIGSEQDK